jgi:putative membrane protein
MLLHIGHNLGWGAWHLEPTVVGGALIVVGLYLYGVDRLRRSGGEVPRWRVAAFLGGSLLIFLALTSPLDTAADKLLSFHMLQHVALTAFGPPLVLLGLPPALVERAIGRSHLRRLVGALTLPYVAAATFIVNMWLWHAPPLYELALTELPVHALMHVAFLATGLLFWWPVVQPLRSTAGPRDVTRLVYVFVSGFPMGILALILLASPNVLYDYYETAPRLWGISALADQQVAGVIMGVLGESTAFLAFSYLFFKLMSAEDAAEPSRGGAAGASLASGLE